MKVLRQAALLLSTYVASSGRGAQAAMVGDEVCLTGYIMDRFCIDQGFFIDDPDTMTLEHPEDHSFHCLLDVPQCQESGYVVLTDKNEETDMHCLGYRLDDTDAVLAAGFAAGRKGYCTGCTGDESKPEYGYRATVKGTVKELGDGTNGVTGTPVLENLQILDELDEACETTIVNPVCMDLPAPPVPTPANGAAPTPAVPAGSAQTCPGTLDMTKEIDDSATLFYAVVPSNPPGSGNGILCARLAVENDGWAALGFSEEGTMKDSQAVIGNPADGSVLKYDLVQYGATVANDERQTLQNTFCGQEDGKTIVEFTKLLTEDGEMQILEDGVNTFLHARGGSTVSYHGPNNRMSFELAFGTPAPSIDLQVGDEVCITNYVMDRFCIDQGFFIDDKDTMTLEHPEDHSFHCLLDVPQCQESGYVVLTDKNEETDMHCLGYRLDDTDAVLAAGFAAGRKGYCTGCTGDESKPEYGYRATVKGTVKELGDGTNGVTGTPLLEDITVLDASVECETTIVNPVCMAPPPPPAPSSELKVGDDVCITNYIMDQYCIGLGHFLDNDKIMTLEHPEEHSFHCLLDVSLCKNSGYVVLGDKDEETGMHCLGFRLEESETVIEAGLAAGRNGYCTDCTGDSSKPEAGYRATVKGTVKALGDGTTGVTGTPILEKIEVLDAGVECETTVVPPLCTGVAPVPPEPVPAPAKDCSSQFCEEQLSTDYLLRYQINVPAETTQDVCDQCTISMELVYKGEAWVGIGFSTDGQMIGSEAVIGEEGTVLKYILGGKTDSAVTPMPEEQQTLTDTSMVVNDGQTIVKFTKIMKEPGEIEITTADNTFIWAHGSGAALSYHASRGSKGINLSSGVAEALATPNKAAWLAHGIMAFLAWGVFAPFAVQSSLLRSLLPNGPLWFNLHRALNTTAFALFIAFFSVAVAYIGKEGAEHFSTNHAKMGLAMFIMACLQVFGGIFRPHLPAPDSDEEKTSVRKGWEVGHRLMGAALLACGFWQMSEGIKLYAVKYSVSTSDQDSVTIAYWVWIGIMAAIIVLGGAYFKLKGNASSDDAPQAAASAVKGDDEEEEVP